MSSSTLISRAACSNYYATMLMIHGVIASIGCKKFGANLDRVACLPWHATRNFTNTIKLIAYYNPILPIIPNNPTMEAISNKDADYDAVRRLYCCCLHPNSCSKCGQAMSSQDESNGTMKTLMKMRCPRPDLNDVYGNGPLFVSHIPASVKQGKEEGVIVGIDEAGRGSVLGPMVYGAAYWLPSAQNNNQIPSGFQDSKALTDQVRSKLLDEMLANEHIGYAVRALSPNEISRNMLRPHPYNLNAMSHDAAIGIIHKLVKEGVPVKSCYIDTVGDENTYRRRLEYEFPTIQFHVEKKADAKYAVCSAASVGKFYRRSAVISKLLI